MSGPIVVLTGAGLSAESGLGTFRDAGGLWSQYRLEDVATPEGYARDPARVLEFYNARRANLAGATPNAAHRALARLAQEAGAVLVTQNIDNLLERAGAPDVIHVHGELTRSLCAACGARADAPMEMAVDDACPACGTPALRPDVVWFGEMPYHMDRIETALERAALFVAIGTSGQVYPAAGFVTEARAFGARCVELNLERSDIAEAFHDHRIGKASEVVPAWVEEILAGY